MYMEIIREVVIDAVRLNASETGRTVPEVLSEIRQHIDDTQAQHHRGNPSINYENPLCRIGYVYRHVAANATLCERALRQSNALLPASRFHEGPINICALGGGPGTELLAIAKLLTNSQDFMPSDITFTLFDCVSHWAETWQQMAELAETKIAESLNGTTTHFPRIKPQFIGFDALSLPTYHNYTRDVRRADVIVFNYLFSENKERLNEARATVQRLAELAPTECTFVVIDRLEYQTSFRDDVVELFRTVFGRGFPVYTENGSIDWDEDKTALGQELLDALRLPRLKFYTIARDPTVFWFAVRRGERAIQP